MSFEIFDATMPIENASFLPRGETAGAAENAERTLDAALQQAGAAAAREQAAIDRQAMREAMREATALDLWMERTGGTAFRGLNFHDAEPPAPLRKLDPGELALLAGGTGSNFDVWGNPYWDWNFPENDPGDQYPGGAGGGSDPAEEPQPTPCVEASPEGVNLVDINRAGWLLPMRSPRLTTKPTNLAPSFGR